MARIVVVDDQPGRVTAASAFGDALPTAAALVTGKSLPVELVQPNQWRGAAGDDTLVLRVTQGGVTSVKH